MKDEGIQIREHVPGEKSSLRQNTSYLLLVWRFAHIFHRFSDPYFNVRSKAETLHNKSPGKKKPS